MEVEVRLFATFREYLPSRSDGFSFKKEFSQEMEVGKIAQELKLPEDVPKIFVVNGNVVTTDYVARDGDVVSIFPPVAGG
ncbi:MAG: MoaD/ThiS family protein [candidate division WOR-3 bacterium]